MGLQNASISCQEVSLAIDKICALLVEVVQPIRQRYKRIKKSPTNNTKNEEEEISMRNEVGEGVVRMMQSRSQPKNGNANDRSKINQKMKTTMNSKNKIVLVQTQKIV